MNFRNGENFTMFDLFNDPIKFVQCDISTFTDFVIDLCHQNYFGSVRSIEIIHNLNKLKDFRAYFRNKDHPSITNILSDIANIIAETSYSQLSLPFLMEQLRIEKSYLGCNHPELASVVFSIGKIYEGNGALIEANNFFTEAFRLLSSHNRKGQLYASVIYNIGLVSFRQSFYEGAMENFDLAIIEHQAAYGEFHPAVAEIRLRTGMLQLEIGRVQDALNNFLEALMVLRMDSGKNCSKAAECLYGIGLVHETRAEYSDSLNAFYQAVNINESDEDDENDTFTLIILNKIGLIHQLMGETGKAVEVFENLKSVIRLKCGGNDTEDELLRVFGIDVECNPLAAAAA